MNKKPAIQIILAACLFAPAGAWAAASGAGAVFKLGAGSKAAALSEAFTAGAGDPAVMFSNPAGLAHEKGSSAMASHSVWFESVNYTVAAYNRHSEKYGTFGFGLQMLNYGEIDSTDNTGVADGSFSPRDLALSAGLGRALGENWTAGAQVKFLSSKIENSASAFLADLGAQYRRGAVTAGLSLQNAGTKLKYGSVSESVPTQVRLGAAYAWRAVTAYCDMNSPSDAKTWLALGAEYKVYSSGRTGGALRAGYSTRAADARNDKTFPLSLGLGLTMDALGLDYAFVPYGDLGQTHQLTFGYHWGGN